jgi:hypothetical protein
MVEIALASIPLLLLVGSLLLGVYPGCETLVRFSERIASRPRPRPASTQARPAAPPLRSVAGGLLIAFGLARRPPPLAH